MNVTILLIGILTTGGLSIHSNELKDESFIGCTNISKNQETNDYVKKSFKTLPKFPLSPNVIRVPDICPYDDGSYQRKLYLVSQKSSMFSITVYTMRELYKNTNKAPNSICNIAYHFYLIAKFLYQYYPKIKKSFENNIYLIN